MMVACADPKLRPFSSPCRVPFWIKNGGVNGTPIFLAELPIRYVKIRFNFKCFEFLKNNDQVILHIKDRI